MASQIDEIKRIVEEYEPILAVEMIKVILAMPPYEPKGWDAVKEAFAKV